MSSLVFLQLLAATWASLLAYCHSLAPNDRAVAVSALTAFKESVQEDPRHFLSNWNADDVDLCSSWSGIRCSQTRDNVVSLNLSNLSLRGFIVRDLGSLTSLQELVLRNNNFIGTIPNEIGMLKNLKLLDLSMNQLTGPIPHKLGYLTNLIKLNLQSNGLTGTIPIELAHLKNLTELRLAKNKLQGTIPGSMYTSQINAADFCQLAHLKVVDFSDNHLNGIIPSCLKNISRSSFQGNCFMDKDSKSEHTSKKCGHEGYNSDQRQAGDNYSVRWHHGSSRPVWLLALEIITGTVVGLLLFVAIFTATRRFKKKSSVVIPWKKTKNRRDHVFISIDKTESLKDVLRISRQELEIACEDFSNIIGSFPDSWLYKGTVKDGPEIAVISLCIPEERWTSYLEFYFQREVADLARLNHENTCKLLGYCKENKPFSRMLVFEYASNGTLYEHLHYGQGFQLPWIRRMKIVIGIARGLKYLHTELQPPFILSELNSNTIYLTEDFSPKLVDFERWKTVLAKSEKTYSWYMNTGLAFRGFRDLIEKRHLDIQGNTFAFGVILLEIVSGRPPYCKDTACIVEWAREFLELPEVISYLVDPELKYFSYNDLRIICEVVNLCIQSNPSERPSMQVLCAMLEDGIDVSAEADLKESPLAWAELALST